MNKTTIYISVLVVASLILAPLPAMSSTVHDIQASPASSLQYRLVPFTGYDPSWNGHSITEGGTGNLSRSFNPVMNVFISLHPSNSSLMQAMLIEIGSPESPLYHHYLSYDQFVRFFSPPVSVYDKLVNHYSRFPGMQVKTYGDRLGIYLIAPMQTMAMAFNVSFVSRSAGGFSFYAPSNTPEIPSLSVGYVSQIYGLSNFSQHLLGMSLGTGLRNTLYPQSGSYQGYPEPVTYSGIQFIYGSDLQVAYGERSLFREYGYPVGQVEATILWSGKYIGNQTSTPYGDISNNTLVGPYVPNDIYSYWNETLPSNESHSNVIPVPLNGAPYPGPLSSYDSTGATMENTLDVDMIGSLAPGSTIYNVYGSTPSISNLDAAFAFILNPNSSVPGLRNVSVISNSWGSKDFNDSAWYSYLEEAQLRGITVLAASGDSGDNSNSSKYFGSNLWFPSAMAYDSFGDIAVGGTNLTLNSNLVIENQTNWYIPTSSGIKGAPLGTTSGISHTFSEPSWQTNSMANQLISGNGRGVPDISAIANNTLVTYTTDGYTYYATNASSGGKFYYVYGTSIASPVEAGIIATIDHVMKVNGQPMVGFIDPVLYQLGDYQYGNLTNTSTTGYIVTSHYHFGIPYPPFYPVIYGRNHVYTARYGYSLLDGWGSINAYNLTVYLLNSYPNESISPVSGVRDNVSIQGLRVTSYLNGNIYTYYNASIQQNIVVADSLGSPIYWVQNVVYVNGSNSTGFAVNYTGWVVYPFFGLYRQDLVYKYSFPAGKVIRMPHDFVMTSVLERGNSVMQSYVDFSVNGHSLNISVPGGSYIIGASNYSYVFHNGTVENGPSAVNGYTGGLSPQFTIAGGPGGSTGDFSAPTRGTVSVSLLPYGTSVWEKAVSVAMGPYPDQTAERSSNLSYVMEANGSYEFYAGSNSTYEGIFSYEKLASFNVSFIESGLPANTSWTVSIGNYNFTTSSRVLNISLPNGTYSYSIDSKGYSAVNSTGSFTVKGKNLTVNVTFRKITGTGSSVYEKVIILGVLLLIIAAIIGAIYRNRKSSGKSP